MKSIQLRSDSRYPIDRERVRGVVQKALEKEGLVSEVVVSINVVGGRQMRRINREFNHADEITDVLSFPFLDPLSNPKTVRFMLPPNEPQILGEMIICYPQAVTQARQKGILVDDEVDFLVDHGMQHLLGHHHE